MGFDGLRHIADECDVPWRGEGSKGDHRLVDGLCDTAPFAAVALSRVGACQDQKIAGQSRQVVHLHTDTVQGLAVHGRGALMGQGDVDLTLDHGERRAQFMGGVSGEAALAVKRLFHRPQGPACYEIGENRCHDDAEEIDRDQYVAGPCQVRRGDGLFQAIASVPAGFEIAEKDALQCHVQGGRKGYHDEGYTGGIRQRQPESHAMNHAGSGANGRCREPSRAA